MSLFTGEPFQWMPFQYIIHILISTRKHWIIFTLRQNSGYYGLKQILSLSNKASWMLRVMNLTCRQNHED